MAGIYIHIPFCKKKCAYCDFYSLTSAGRMDEYLRAVRREMEARVNFLGGEPIRTLYFGGGTPSLCAPDRIGEIIASVKEIWGGGNLQEVTLEANPDDLTASYLEALRRAGVNRLSIGLQSFSDEGLRLMNRRHTAVQNYEAVRLARGAGFGNISIDLIYGIPGMGEAEWERSVGAAAGLGVEHISAYHLTIEPGTAFGRMQARGELSPVAEEQSRKQYLALCRLLGKAGYRHYEISNFALPGRESRHNSSYWTGEPYLGLGPGAHSFDGARRVACRPSLEDYLGVFAGAENDAESLYETEILSAQEHHNEYVMLSLRREEGIDMEEFGRKFGREKLERLTALAAGFAARGTMRSEGGRLTIPADQWLISDGVIARFFE